MSELNELKPLNPRQERFCQEYMTDLNGTQAAIRAGYSLKSANEQSSENLAKPHIKKRIEELKAKRSEKVGVTAERVIEELAKIGFSDEFELEGFTRLELKDKLKALEMLARHSGAFNSDESSKTVLKVTIGGND